MENNGFGVLGHIGEDLGAKGPGFFRSFEGYEVGVRLFKVFLRYLSVLLEHSLNRLQEVFLSHG